MLKTQICVTRPQCVKNHQHPDDRDGVYETSEKRHILRRLSAPRKSHWIVAHCLYLLIIALRVDQLEDRRDVGENSCISGDGTDQRVQSLLFMMMMMMGWPCSGSLLCPAHVKGSSLKMVKQLRPKHVGALTLRRLMSYIYIYGAPILDVSRSHTTTQHSR